MITSANVTVAVSIDTEEDDWGVFDSTTTSVRNISHLVELQECFDRYGARPTYLVNRAPLLHSESIEVLGALAQRESVEIGAHCHPWNTPPLNGNAGPHRSMMCALSAEENRAKLEEVCRCLDQELGIEPNAFRAGRWAFGPTVASALVDLGIGIDCSVSPFIDWTPISGPDYSNVPHRPYRCRPERPFEADSDGELIELPTTVGFLSGDQRSRARARTYLERSSLKHVRAVGVLDRLGLLTRRWLSPESSSGQELVRLADAWVASGETFVQLTFHSTTLLVGATPFVRSEDDRARFLDAVRQFLAYCQESGFAFRTLSEAAAVEVTTD